MSDRYSHEGASDKFENAIKGRGWKPAKRRRFHDWLGSHYALEKDNFSDRELRQKADEFASQDRDLWND